MKATGRIPAAFYHFMNRGDRRELIVQDELRWRTLQSLFENELARRFKLLYRRQSFEFMPAV